MLHKAPKGIEEVPGHAPAQLELHPPDFLAVFAERCTLTDGRLGFAFTTGEAVTLQLLEH